MFYTTDKSRKLQRSSELGLYRDNDCDSDLYSRSIYRYVTVLLITIIIISLMCLITYNYVSEPNPVILQPVHIKNDNISNTDIDRSYVQVANMSYSKEIISGPVDATIAESVVTDDEIQDEPVASEFRHEVGNNQRRQIIKTPERKSPRPFIYENRDPIPIGFITPVGQINTQEHPQTHGRNKAKNIQEIIKYLTDHQTINESVESGDNTRKRNKKRQRGDNNSQSLKKGKGTSNIFTYTADPFFPYKPQNPSDVNLLATNGFRFAPTVQIEPKKPKKTIKQTELTNNVPHRHAQNVPVHVNFDSHAAGDEKKVRKRKNRYSRPAQYGNYGYEHNNPYNDNNFYNQGERQPPSGLNYWNRFRNNGMEYNRNKIRNDLLHESEVKPASQIMVHLNLYPKKKRHNGANRNIELLKDEFQQQNCTDIFEEPTDGIDDLAQIKNASEFNQLMQNIKFSYVNHKEEVEEDEPVPNNNGGDLFQIKDTILKLNEPVVTDDFKHVRNNNHNLNGHNVQDIEVLKSIGFTVLNSNFTPPESNSEQYYTHPHNHDNPGHWHPMPMHDDGYLNDQQLSGMSSNVEHVTEREMNHRPGLNIDFVIKDTTDNYNEFMDETVTLPLPSDIFEKYFNRKPPLKRNVDWNDDMLLDNPNLINHKSRFSDES